MQRGVRVISLQEAIEKNPNEIIEKIEEFLCIFFLKNWELSEKIQNYLT